ncbi:MAG: crtE [Candidatus Saccharibacteria bacterium]|nr:crtE [Candidatus Saccharibacteria bacterium]
MKQEGTTPKNVITPAESKTMIDAFLNPLFKQLTENARRVSPHYETLWQDVHKLYSAGGKRLRSYMTLLTYEAFSKKPAKTILPAAAAAELLHMAMLVHDDVIDRDDIRYGIKNVTGEYLIHYEELIKDEADRRHYANSAAILAGDLLISEAYILITETKTNPAAIVAAQHLIAKAMFHVIAGELLDTEASFRGGDSAHPLLIAEEKTASYSFVSPFLMGAVLAEATLAQQEILQKLGEQLGIGYQLRDDILGIFGDEAKTGKSASGDIKEGKQTLLIEEFGILATEAQQTEFRTIFGRHDVSEKELKRIKTLLVESGAKQAVEIQIDAFREYTLALLESLNIDAPHKEAFSTLIELCLKRDK